MNHKETKCHKLFSSANRKIANRADGIADVRHCQLVIIIVMIIIRVIVIIIIRNS